MKVKVKSLSRVRLFATPWTVAHHASPSMGFSGQEYWSGVPLPSPIVGPYQLSILYVAVCICQAQSPNFPMPPLTLGKEKLFSTSVILFLFCR